MSSIFSGVQNSLGSTLTQGAVAAGEAKAKLKDKKEETSRTIEEGLASLKIMMGGKGISKAVINDPLVRKFAGQAKKKAADGISDAVKSGISKLTGVGDVSEADATAAATNTVSNPLFNPDAEAEAAASDQAELDALTAKGASRLADGEDVFRTGYDEDEASGLKNLFTGSGKLVRASDIEKTIQTDAAADPEAADAAVAAETTLGGKLSAARDITNPEYLNVADNAGLAKALPGDDLSAGEYGIPQSGGMTEAESVRAAQLNSNISERASAAAAQAAEKEAADTAAKTAAETAAKAATASIPAEVDVAAQGTSAVGAVFDSGKAAADAAASAAKTAGTDALAAGTDAAVGGGEAILGALDAIPGLDLFTFAAGAGLAIGAGVKKHLPNKPVMPPPPQAHVAYAAGFQNV